MSLSHLVSNALFASSPVAALHSLFSFGGKAESTKPMGGVWGVFGFDARVSLNEDLFPSHNARARKFVCLMSILLTNISKGKSIRTSRFLFIDVRYHASTNPGWRGADEL